MRALVVVEHNTKAIRAGSLSAAAFAQAVAAIDGGAMEILVLGHDIGALASSASKVAPVLVADHELLRYPIADRYAAVIVDVVRSRKIDLIVAASTTFARDIVGRAAGLLGGSMASDVVGHEFRDGRLLLKRPMYAGAMLATVALAGHPQIITIRPSAYAPATPGPAPFEVQNIVVDVAADIKFVDLN